MVSSGIAMLLAVLTACGGSGSTSPSAAGSPSFNNHGAKTVSGSSIDLEADNYYFEPSVIRGTPGQKVTINLKNSSATEHNFTVKDQNVDVDIDAHGSKTATVTIPSSGSVSFYCEYHQSHGMAGLIQPT
jgi:plastocyanin